MASKGDYLEHLASVPLFRACTKKELNEVAKAADDMTVPAGKVLVEQGRTGHEAFVIVTGTASVERNGQKITDIGPGAVVGDISMLDHGPRTATVTATTEMEVLVLDQRHFTALFETVPTLVHKLLAVLASRIRDLDRATYG